MSKPRVFTQFLTVKPPVHDALAASQVSLLPCPAPAAGRGRMGLLVPSRSGDELSTWRCQRCNKRLSPAANMELVRCEKEVRRVGRLMSLVHLVPSRLDESTSTNEKHVV